MTPPDSAPELPVVPLSRARQRLLARLHRARTRQREGLVLVEGPRAVATALAAGAHPRFLLVAASEPTPEAREVARRAAGSGAELLRVPDEDLATAADTVTPQGLLAAVEEPQATLADVDRALAREDASGPLVVLDGVQDPGNAGTLLRSAAAFGAPAVVALDGTTDPWSPKCVRATVGEAFRLPVVRAPWAEVEAWLEARGLPLLVADAGGVPVSERSWPHPAALVVGNEARGPRPGVRAAATHTLALPLARGVESLNAGVAGSVLLWALRGPPPTPSTHP